MPSGPGGRSSRVATGRKLPEAGSPLSSRTHALHIPKGQQPPGPASLRRPGTARSWQLRVELPGTRSSQRGPGFRPSLSRTSRHVAADLSSFERTLCVPANCVWFRAPWGSHPRPPPPGRAMALLPQTPRKENVPLRKPLPARGHPAGGAGRRKRAGDTTRSSTPRGCRRGRPLPASLFGIKTMRFSFEKCSHGAVSIAYRTLICF